MKIVSNEKLINRNKKIGQYTTMAALVILAIGLYYSFVQPEKITITFGALLFGFLLTQVGVFYGNRWGRSPRPDEHLTSNLKGLEEKYTLYHYTSGIAHLLAGPTGLWAIVTSPASGKITFDESKNRFRQQGGSFYMKLFGSDSIGKPDVDINYAISDLKKALAKKAPDLELPEPKGLLVFTNEKAVIDIQNSPIPAVAVDKAKDFIRKQPKESPEMMDAINRLQKILPTESITA